MSVEGVLLVNLARRVVAIVLTLQFLTVASAGADSDKRVALILGNSDYRHFPDLRNPRNDARDVSAALEELGFDIVYGEDLDRASMFNALFEFADKLRTADVSLFYYAGHGIQIDDANHIVPVDAALAQGQVLNEETVAVDRIVQLMNEFTETALVFLDACRDNPLTNSIPAGQRDGAIGRGLARIRAGGGTYVAFATAPGSVAYDGEGENSPFTAALLDHIGTPNLDVRLMMSDVRRDVFVNTGQRQIPWENNSLIGRFYFRQDTDLARLDDQQRTEAEAWQVLRDSTRREDFAAFLRDFPDGSFASLATLKIETLDGLDEAASRERSEFILARSQNDVEAWRSFIDAHPDSLFAEIGQKELIALEDEIARNRLSLEEIHWRSIRNSVSPNDFVTFLSLHPRGEFEDLARQRLELSTRAAEITSEFNAQSDVELEREIKRRVSNVPVQFLQYGLTALGHQVSDISGVLDPPTRAAIRNYQATIGETQTGRLTAQQIVDLILVAALLGDSNAMTAAGIMTASGDGLRQDEQTARLWLDRASTAGNGLAMVNLGILYRDGRGGGRDLEKARSLLSVAVTLGVEAARPILRSLSE